MAAKTISRSGSFAVEKQPIYDAACALLARVERPLPCTRIAVGLEQMVEAPKKGQASIAFFMNKQQVPQQKRDPQETGGAGGKKKGNEIEKAGRTNDANPAAVASWGSETTMGPGSWGKRPRTSHEDPNFMEGFFQASRLHFIGSWKERFEEILASMPPPPPLPNPPVHKRRILHVDMDCFFAAIAMRDNPTLREKAVVVCWSRGEKGSNASSSEISSANYKARGFGIKAGMRLGKARQLCPDVVTAPYEFRKYTDAALKLYKCVFAITPHVQGVSCDECFLDISACIIDAGRSLDAKGDDDAHVDALAETLRENIRKETGCVASIGCGHNRLMARLATKKAKPNGYYRVHPKDAQGYLSSLPVAELPGVGYRTRTKLEKLGVTEIAQILQKRPSHWQDILGRKLGQTLYDYARGIDKRKWERRPTRKSVGAQLSWGVRFQTHEEVAVFLRKLSSEVANRMQRYGVKGRSISFKLWRAVKNAPDSWRKGHVGHGVCDIINRTATTKQPTREAATIAETVLQVWQGLKVDATEVRGVGISMSGLTPLDGKQLSATKLSRIHRPIAPAGKQSVFDPKNPPAWYSSYLKPKQPQDEGDKAGVSRKRTRQVQIDGALLARTTPKNLRTSSSSSSSSNVPSTSTKETSEPVGALATRRVPQTAAELERRQHRLPQPLSSSASSSTTSPLSRKPPPRTRENNPLIPQTVRCEMEIFNELVSTQPAESCVTDVEGKIKTTEEGVSKDIMRAEFQAALHFPLGSDAQNFQLKRAARVVSFALRRVLEDRGGGDSGNMGLSFPGQSGRKQQGLEILRYANLLATEHWGSLPPRVQSKTPLLQWRKAVAMMRKQFLKVSRRASAQTS